MLGIIRKTDDGWVIDSPVGIFPIHPDDQVYLNETKITNMDGIRADFWVVYYEREYAKIYGDANNTQYR